MRMNCRATMIKDNFPFDEISFPRAKKILNSSETRPV